MITPNMAKWAVEARAQNYFLKFGYYPDEAPKIKTRTKILELVNRYPYGLNQAEICRHINGQALNNDTLENPCTACVDFANPRKRNISKKDEIFKPSLCKPRYRAIRANVKRMIKANLVFAKMEKRLDPFCRRGWDFFKMVYPVIN